jgi:hypothetical protein
VPAPPGWSWAHRPSSRATLQERKEKGRAREESAKRGQGHYRGRSPKAPARGLRGAAVGATPQRLPPQRLLSCGPSLTSSPRRVPPPGMVTERPESRRTGVSHLVQRRGLILREDCYNVVTRAPTVGNDSVVPDSKRERGVHARYALLGTRSAGGGRRPGHCVGAVPIGPPLAKAARRGPGLACSTPPRPVNGERGAG